MIKASLLPSNLLKSALQADFLQAKCAYFSGTVDARTSKQSRCSKADTYTLHASRDEVLAMDDVSFSYAAQSGGDTRAILQGAHLCIHRGNFVALMGANGAGKTTLLALVLGLLIPQQGTIRLFGETGVSIQQRSRIAYVSQSNFQAYRIFPTTVEEVIHKHCSYLKKTRLFCFDEQVFQRANSLLDEFQLNAVVKSTLRELSGGQLQRLALLLALLKNPQFLVLDEPTSGIDAQSSAVIMKHLSRCCSDGMAVLIVTHHVDEVRAYATQLYRIENMHIKQLTQNNLPEQDTLLQKDALLQKDGDIEQDRLAEKISPAEQISPADQISPAEQIKQDKQVDCKKRVARHV